MKKSRFKKSRFVVTLLPTFFILILFTWLLIIIFEGEKPQVRLEPLPDYMNQSTDFNIEIVDQKMGLRTVKVNIQQDGPAIPILKKSFEYKGLLNKSGIHAFKEKITLDPKKLNLVQGKTNLIIETHDFSKRRGGDGNLTILEHKMIVDTIPPSVTAISKSHNVNVGGSGLIEYRVSPDTDQSGVFVNDVFFPGVPFGKDPKNGIFICYFAVPYDFKKGTNVYLWAKDNANNETKKTFFNHIIKKRFPADNIKISEQLLEIIISSFPYEIFEPNQSNIEKYLFLNRKIRKENHAFIEKLCQSPTNKKLWDGTWLRMKNAATMAKFADQRIYYYKDNVIDRVSHLGIDLASLANSPVQAANNGNVIFAQDLGIYGQTVLIDHGQGLYTMYSHLSNIDVTVDQTVMKGDTIGITGTTGLATGDHLHFGFLVHGVPVNPAEWWDPHWIKDNVERKLNYQKSEAKSQKSE